MRLTRLGLVGALVAAGACDDGSGPTTPDAVTPDEITTDMQGTVQFDGKVHVFPVRGRQAASGVGTVGTPEAACRPRTGNKIGRAHV